MRKPLIQGFFDSHVELVQNLPYENAGDKMRNRIDRIKLMIDELSKNNNCMEKSELCVRLDISKVTLKRYLDFLKGWGYKFDYRMEKVRVLEQGQVITDAVFSKASYISFKIFMYIYNNNPCSRSSIKRYFCKTSKQDNGFDDKMTIRNMDIHLNRLIELGYIEKNKTNSEIYYGTTGNVIAADSIPFDKLLGLFSYLNIYRGALPFQNKVDNILNKLESALLNYIRRSSEAFEDVKLAYEIFPECIKPWTDNDMDQLAKELEKYCRTNTIVRLMMDSGVVLRVHPLCVIYNSYSGYWYLICKSSLKADSYELVRLDNITKVKFAGTDPRVTQKDLDMERQLARQEVEESFAICVEEPIKVKLLFKEDKEINEEIENRMNGCNGSLMKLDGIGCCYEGEIQGTMDFFTWLRRLGSSAVIIEPEHLREMHIASAVRTLNLYSKEQEG